MSHTRWTTIWTFHWKCHMLCLNVILLFYRVTCLWFCNKRFCNKKRGVNCAGPPTILPKQAESSPNLLLFLSDSATHWQHWGLITAMVSFRKSLWMVQEASPTFFLQLISSFKALWSENMLDMVSIFLNLLRLVLCLNIWLILENVPCALEKNICSNILGRKTLNVNYVHLV